MLAPGVGADIQTPSNSRAITAVTVESKVMAKGSFISSACEGYFVVKSSQIYIFYKYSVEELLDSSARSIRIPRSTDIG